MSSGELTQSSLPTAVTETAEEDKELENATFPPPITSSILLLLYRLTPYSLYAAVSVGLEVLFL